MVSGFVYTRLAMLGLPLLVFGSRGLMALITTGAAGPILTLLEQDEPADAVSCVANAS